MEEDSKGVGGDVAGVGVCGMEMTNWQRMGCRPVVVRKALRYI